MQFYDLLLHIAAILAALVTLGGIAFVIYAAFKKTRNDEGRKADRELIDTLKTQNELLRQEKGDTSDKLEQALRELSELRGEVKTLRDMPLQATSIAISNIDKTLSVILENQITISKDLNVKGLKTLKEA
jgi:arginine exporter protein ArgO